MPLKWQRNINPYVDNYFGILRLGSGAQSRIIVAQAKNLCQRLSAGEKLMLGQRELDQHSVNEASTQLREPASLAHELLLVHPQAPKEEGGKLHALLEKAKQLSFPASARPKLELSHPLGMFWFIEPPRELVSRPAWKDLGLPVAGDDADLELDMLLSS